MGARGRVKGLRWNDSKISIIQISGKTIMIYHVGPPAFGSEGWPLKINDAWEKNKGALEYILIRYKIL